MTLVEKFEEIIFEHNENVFDSLPRDERILFALVKKLFEEDEIFKEHQLNKLLKIIEDIQNE